MKATHDYANRDWGTSLSQENCHWEGVKTTLLMDIRHELRALNRLLRAPGKRLRVSNDKRKNR